MEPADVGAASLRNRVGSAEVVLQRLANASPADRVAKALTTLRRVVKTIYILRYIHEEDLRRRVQPQLNRGGVTPLPGTLAVLC
jgi:TnpA family transposase